MDRGTVRERASTWPHGREAAHAGLPALPDLRDLAQRCADAMRAAAAAEAAPGRLVPWVPVAFGLGIVAYFTAEHEPSWLAAVLLAAALVVVAVAARRQAAAFSGAVLIAAVAAGFAGASLKSTLIAHPVLERPVFGVSVAGFVEVREERERTDRVVLKVVNIEGDRLDTVLERVRLSVRRVMAPLVGSYVTLKARLNPPLPPLRPGGYDFARDLYFQRIGAIGFVTGSIKVETPPAPPGPRLGFLSLVDGMRDGIDRRIRA